MTLRQDRLVAAGFVLPAALFTAAVFLVPLWNVLVQSVTNPAWTLAGYRSLLGSTLFWRVLQNTIEISVISTFVAFLLAYPMAYHLSRQTPRRRVMFLMLVMLPFWTSILVKSYAFMVLLGQSGIINQLLGIFGLGPVKLLFNRFGVMVGMSHFLIPFMVFPILAALQNQPPELARAAAIMGAGKLRIFWRVTLPLSLPGVMAGCLLVFILSLGFYVIPALLGGRQDMMLANLVDFYAREVLNWQMASAVAVLLVAAAVIAAMLLSKVRGGASLLAEDGR